MNNNTDPTNGAIVGTQTTTQTNNEPVNNEPTKTYTQDDINNSFNAGMSKAKKELEKSEDYKNYLEWKKTNQNDSEKIIELQNSVDTLTRENNLLKATNEVAKSNVKPEFLKFVTSEVMSMVNDTTDFDTALKNYKKESPQFFGDTVIKKVQSSPTLNGGGTKETTTNDIMNNLLRGNKD